MERITIRDGRYIFGRHIMDLAKIEPVSVWHNDTNVWLTYWSNREYNLIPFESLSYLRDDYTTRPFVTGGGYLCNIHPIN